MKHQIDYQTQKFRCPSVAISSFDIPLPINCILKSVNVEKTNDLGISAMLQVEIKLVEEIKNSNIRVEHQLSMGNINSYAFVNSSSPFTYWNKTLSYLYDHPIQKEGISLQINVYNATGSSADINVHWQVKNLEGAI